MKVAYFGQDAADADDHALAAAKRAGDVPPGCLLGGRLVVLARQQKRDPCRLCSGPRAKCGGRPFEDLQGSTGGDSVSRAILDFRETMKEVGAPATKEGREEEEETPPPSKPGPDWT